MGVRIQADQQKILSCLASTKGFYLMGPITYPSGNRAPFNVDTMTALSDPGRARIIGQALGEHVKKLDVDLILGIVNAGVPLATLASHYSGIPFGYVRKEVDQRTGEVLQGQYFDKKKAVLIDDVIGRGGTKDKVLANLKDKFIIKDLIVLMDGGAGYQQAMDKWEKNSGVRLNYLARWDEITKAMDEAKTIPAEVGEMMIDYLANPDDWQTDEKKWQRFEEFKKSHKYQKGEPIL